MSWNIQKPGDYINGPLTVAGTLTVTGAGPHSIAGQIASTGSTAGFQMQPRDGSGANWLLYNPTGDDFRVYNNIGNDVVIVNNIGNVGIGVAPSAGGSGFYKTLELGKAGCGLFTGTASLTASELTYLSGNAVLAYNAGPEWKYGNNGSAAIYGIEDGIHKWYNAPSGSAGGVFVPTIVMTLNANGALALQGGNASANGIGITFPSAQSASTDANTLDDYEEGTWTPSLVFGGANVGMTGTFVGRYTKVGRAVTINGIIALTAKGSSTGLAKITGLPFVSANATAEHTAVSLRLDRVSFADCPCGYIGPNVIVVELENTTNAGTVTNLTEANFINASVVIISATYTV